MWIVALVWLAHGGILGAWFHPYDDARHLAGAMDGRLPIGHFRPAQLGWNRALLAFFGTEPLGWHAVSLALHAATALGVAVLARSAGALAAALGGGLFAALHAPLEAVAWISAESGQLSVFFVVIAGIAWARHLEATGRAALSWYAAAWFAVLAATASKEDCVFAAPLLVGLHVATRGWRDVLRLASFSRYLPFALLGLAYVAVAFDATLWADRPGVREYALSPDLVPRLLRSPALLAWPRHVSIDAPPAWTLPVGTALSAALFVLAALRRASWARLVVLGGVVAVAGLLPVLPGPWEAAASSRFGYPAAVGVALVSAGIVQGARDVFGRRPALAAASLVALGSLAHAWSTRGTIEWRFVRASEIFEARIRATLERVDASERGAVLFVAPPVWNAVDHERAVSVFAGHRSLTTRRVELPLARIEAELERWSARGELTIWRDGSWRALELGSIPHVALQRAAAQNDERHDRPGIVPGTWVERHAD